MIPDDQVDVERLLTAFGRAQMQALQLQAANKLLGAEIDRLRAQIHDKNIRIMALDEQNAELARQLAGGHANDSTVDLDPIDDDVPTGPMPKIVPPVPKRGNDPLTI